MAELAVAAVIVGLLLFAAKLSEEAVERIGFPGFLGAILAGVLLGEGGLGVVRFEDVESAAILFFIGINFTLFLAGVEELSNPAFIVPSKSDLAYGLLFLAAPTAVAIVLVALVEPTLTLPVAVALAIVLSVASAGPLVKVLLARGEVGPREASLLRMALVSELSGLTVFNALAQGFDLVKLVASIAFVLSVVYVGRGYLDEFLLAVEKYIAVREAPFAIVVALVLTASYLAEIVGFNSAVTALVFGAFLSEYLMERPLYLERIRAFTYGFLEPLFFIGVGLQATEVSYAPLALSLLLFASTAAAKVAVAKLRRLQLWEAVSLLAKGGVDAALLSTMLQSNLISANLYTASLMAIILSSIAASSAVRIRRRVPEPLRLKLKDIPLDRDIVREDSYADYAAEIVSRKGAAVVVDDNLHPVGYITAEDFVGISTELLSKLPVRLLLRMEVPVVAGDTTVSQLLSDPSLIHEPIIAVVNEHGEVIGTISPRKLLAVLLHKHPTRKTGKGGSGAPAPQHPREEPA
jgi:Kef-type K+ transport system membrane component KefB